MNTVADQESQPTETGQLTGANSQKPETYFDLVKLVLIDTTLDVEQKKILIDEIRKGTVSDRWTYRWAIWILGAVVILSVGALWGLSSGGFEAPDGLVAIGSASVGGLAGLLTPGRGGEGSST